jgi:hypothetical protein
MANLLQAHLTMTFTFTVDITDDETNVPPDVEDPEKIFERNINRRLLLAVLAQREQLQHCLLERIALEMENVPNEQRPNWDAFLLVQKDMNYYELLAPTIANMNEEDQQHFRHLVEREQKHELNFHTQIQDFLDSFHIKLEHISIDVSVEQETSKQIQIAAGLRDYHTEGDEMPGAI